MTTKTNAALILHTKTYLGYDSTTNNVQGLLNIKNGEFTLTSDGDAISSCCDLLIENGVFKITTFGGADNAPSHESDNPGQDNGGRPGGKGPRASSSTSAVSCKGIKACTFISSTEYYGSNLKIIGFLRFFHELYESPEFFLVSYQRITALSINRS